MRDTFPLFRRNAYAMQPEGNVSASGRCEGAVGKAIGSRSVFGAVVYGTVSHGICGGGAIIGLCCFGDSVLRL